ncbi:hypothetical protein NK8_55730 (plasmid) [Caballeronia sp. NK8]|uniref:hypothetical protein n=1 Tax=Caballeronia sp. NK8 TaxID=140098 RepID=UPI001BB74257|nr:hypothetical protein [Caballeronia sp. NK8]BCQ27384.1 hypothetical protein NK8_55730 [Caballeronia sp. NK8]
MTPPTIHTTAHVESHARVQWDSEGFTVHCEIDYLPSASYKTTGNLSEALEQRFAIVPATYVITAGTLSMLLDSEKRITEFDFYTNPTEWAKATSPFFDAIPGTPHIDAIFDDNGHSEAMRDPDVLYEPRRGTLYLSWGDALRWHGVAQQVALGVGPDNRLAQLRIDGLFVEAEKLEPKRRWTRLFRA